MHDIDRTQPYGHEMEMESYEGETLTEDEMMEYAAELMEVQSEQEFENFLGDIVSSVAQGLGSIIPGPAGQALGGLLKGAAKKLLPIAGSALGGFVGGPVGAMIGGRLGSSEMESEEREWEAAQRYVRFAAQAARNLAQGQGEYDVTPTQAVVSAAQTHAPELIAQPGEPPAGVRPPMPGSQSFPPPPAPRGACHCGQHHHHRRTGNWTRQGDVIVVHL